MYPFDGSDVFEEHRRKVSRANCIAWMRQGMNKGQSIVQRIRNRVQRS